MSGAIVEIAGGAFAIPFECPCCGAAADSDLTVLPRSATGHVFDGPVPGIEFPYCSACVAHARLWSGASLEAANLGLIGIVVGGIVALASHIALGLIVAGTAIVIAMVVATRRRALGKARCGPACASPDIAVAYRGWSGGVTQLSFESPTYTARFAEQNAAELVNVSAALHALLEAHRIARLVVPTPAAAVSVVAAPPTVAEWIAMFEDAPSRFARRHRLQYALDVFHEPEDRDRLIASACRLELAPVLDKLEPRSSLTARRRQLEAAISQFRGGNLGRELRDAVVRELDAQLRALV